LLSPAGPPGELLRAWGEGRFELIVSTQLLEEVERALGYPRLRDRVTREEANAFVDELRTTAIVAPDPETDPAVHSADSGDDYLLALAESVRAPVVSGDQHLLALADVAAVLTPRDFLALLGD
jgi:predicted nucleic acid-binding protein